MNHSLRIAALDQRPRQGLQRTAGRQALPHRLAQDLQAVKVHHRGDKQPALRRRHIGDVGHPDLIGLVGADRSNNRLGAIGWSWSLWVVRTFRPLPVRPLSPSCRMSRSTRLWLQHCPLRRSSSVIRGLP